MAVWAWLTVEDVIPGTDAAEVPTMKREDDKETTSILEDEMGRQEGDHKAFVFSRIEHAVLQPLAEHYRVDRVWVGTAGSSTQNSISLYTRKRLLS